MIEIVIEIIVIEIGMGQTRLFQWNRFHCAENRQSRAQADFFGNDLDYFSITIFCTVELWNTPLRSFIMAAHM